MATPDHYELLHQIAQTLNRLAATQPGTLYCMLVTEMQRELETLEKCLQDNDKRNEEKMSEMWNQLHGDEHA